MADVERWWKLNGNFNEASGGPAAVDTGTAGYTADTYGNDPGARQQTATWPQGVGYPVPSNLPQNEYSFSFLIKDVTNSDNHAVDDVLFCISTTWDGTSTKWLAAYWTSSSNLRVVGTGFSPMYDFDTTGWWTAANWVKIGVTISESAGAGNRIRIWVDKVQKASTVTGEGSLDGTLLSDHRLTLGSNGSAAAGYGIALTNDTIAAEFDNVVIWDSPVTDFSYMDSEDPSGPGPATLSLCASSFNAGSVGTPYSQTIPIVGGTAPYCAAAVAPGPGWLTANVVGTDLILGGTPDVAAATLTKVGVIDAVAAEAYLCATLTVTQPATGRTILVGNQALKRHGSWTAGDYLQDPDGARMGTQAESICAATTATALCTALAAATGADMVGAQFAGALSGAVAPTVEDLLQGANSRFAGGTFDWVPLCAGIGQAFVDATGVIRTGGSGSAVTPSVTPLIAAPSPHNYGKVLVLIGRYAANTVTLRSESDLPGSNLVLHSNMPMTLGENDTLVLVYDASTGKWTEIARSSDGGAFCAAMINFKEAVTADWTGGAPGDVGVALDELAQRVTDVTNEAYTPLCGAHWADPDPTTIQQALDRIAAVVGNPTPIP